MQRCNSSNPISNVSFSTLDSSNSTFYLYSPYSYQSGSSFYHFDGDLLNSSCALYNIPDDAFSQTDCNKEFLGFKNSSGMEDSPIGDDLLTVDDSPAVDDSTAAGNSQSTNDSPGINDWPGITESLGDYHYSQRFTKTVLIICLAILTVLKCWIILFFI